MITFAVKVFAAASYFLLAGLIAAVFSVRAFGDVPHSATPDVIPAAVMPAPMLYRMPGVL